MDAGTLTSTSYVAWLRGKEFVFGEHRLDPAAPFPEAPRGWSRPEVIAYDLPQGLPMPPARRRQADIQANTPARALPTSGAELATWKAYRGFIEAGIEIFWSIYEKGMGDIAGLSPWSGTRPVRGGDVSPVRDPAVVARAEDSVEEEGAGEVCGAVESATAGEGICLGRDFPTSRRSCGRDGVCDCGGSMC